jgi:hypothetical protein
MLLIMENMIDSWLVLIGCFPGDVPSGVAVEIKPCKITAGNFQIGPAKRIASTSARYLMVSLWGKQLGE